ncbi:hypothetical protein [Aeromonas salmonicida]
MSSNNLFHLRHTPLPRRQPMALFYWHEVIDELDTIKHGLPEWARTAPPSEISQVEWSCFMGALIQCFGTLPPKNGDSPGSISHAVLGSEPHCIAALWVRVCAISSAVSELIASHQVKHSEQLVFLLPVSFSERLQMLVGGALLPVAQITQYDLAFECSY